MLFYNSNIHFFNRDINEKLKILTEWHSSGPKKSGCLLIGYEAFRTLVQIFTKRKNIHLDPQQIDTIKKKLTETLLNPGADIVICDEGHVIKNRKSATNVSVSQVKTRKRIILTGTPIQNNLKECKYINTLQQIYLCNFFNTIYNLLDYCMVHFIKPHFLGTEKEFANLYANPIKNGQHKDSSKSEIKFMKQRSFVLHKKLSKFVQVILRNNLKFLSLIFSNFRDEKLLF